MPAIPNSFLANLVSSLDGENTVGIIMLGSVPRSEADSFSDVDIMPFVHKVPPTRVESDTLRCVDGFLVSIHAVHLEDEMAGMRNPHRAIWVVPGLRHAHILLEKDGSVGQVIEAARDFRWEDIRPAADAMVSWQLCNLVEEVYKILGGLEAHNESKTMYAVNNLLFDLAETLLINKGVLVPSENMYFELAQDAAGPDSEWTHQLRLAAAFDPLPSDAPASVARGVASLALYRLTTEMMAEALRPEEAPVVAQALVVMREADHQ